MELVVELFEVQTGNGANKMAGKDTWALWEVLKVQRKSSVSGIMEQLPIIVVVVALIWEFLTAAPQVR